MRARKAGAAVRAAPARRARAAPAALLAALPLALMPGCGADDADAGGRFGTITDCAAIAAPQRVTDPAGDATGDAPAASDLTSVGLSRGPGRTCVEWRAVKDIEAPTAYSVTFTYNKTMAQLDVLVLGGEAPQVVLRTARQPAGADVPGATAGGEGRRLTAVLPTAALRAAGIGEGFTWRAQTVSASGERETGRRPSDCAPACAG